MKVFLLSVKVTVVGLTLTKKPENLLGGALCPKLTIHKIFSTYKFSPLYIYTEKHLKNGKSQTFGSPE